MAPELMKLIFAVLDVSLTMGLTRCYKTEGFLLTRCFKITSRDPFLTPFELILPFFVSTAGDESACKIWLF